MGAISDVFLLPERGGGMAVRAAAFHVVHLRDLFESAAQLLAQARAHGAFILGRSMFETSLMLGALEEPNTRDAIAARWFHDAQADAQKLISIYAAAGEDVTQMRETIRENDRKLTAAHKELGLTSSLRRSTSTTRRDGRIA